MIVTKKLLLIDEDPADRALASVVLSSAFPGSCVCELGDGTKLIRALELGAYDAIITELDLEVASWTFQLEAIRAIRPEAVLVVFSRDADPARQKGALAAGARSYVRKSTQGFLDLAETVREALTEASSDSGAQEQAAASASIADALDVPVDGEPDVTVQADAVWTDGPTAPAITGSEGLAETLRRPLVAALGIVATAAVIASLVLIVGRREPEAAPPVAEPERIGIGSTAEAVSDPPAPEVVASEPELPTQEPEPDEITAAPAQEPPPTPSEAPVSLELSATGSVWIEVAIDGEVVLDTTLEAGQRRTFAADQVIGLRIGNAAGLTIAWNGNDLGSLGADGQVRRLHFLPTRVGVGPPPVVD